MSTQKTSHPINKVGGEGVGDIMLDEARGTLALEEVVLGNVNRLAKECRAIPHGLERNECFDKHVLPLIDELNGLGYSVEWDIEAEQYMLVEDGKEWVHPTIRRR